MDKTEHKAVNVRRQRYFKTSEEVAEHIRCIGKSIIEDADSLCPNPSVINSIKITAEINSSVDITTIKYEIGRIADPRLQNQETTNE